MSEPFVGEIRMFAGNFAPRGWAFCEGQLLAVSQSDALFSLLGTEYGGDGIKTFGLPDMRGRLPIHRGDGPGLSARRLGEKGGAEHVALTVNQLASHDHDIVASTAAAMAETSFDQVLAEGVGVSFYNDGPQDATMASTTIGFSGGSHPHTNLMPSLCVQFIISLTGIYPSRH